MTSEQHLGRVFGFHGMCVHLLHEKGLDTWEMKRVVLALMRAAWFAGVEARGNSNAPECPFPGLPNTLCAYEPGESCTTPLLSPEGHC